MWMGRHATLCSAAQQKYFWRCGFAASFTWPKTVASQDLLFEAISADDIVKNEFVSSHLNSLHLVERPLTFIKAPSSFRGVIDMKVFNKNSLSYYQMWSETKSVHWTQLFLFVLTFSINTVTEHKNPTSATSFLELHSALGSFGGLFFCRERRFGSEHVWHVVSVSHHAAD